MSISQSSQVPVLAGGFITLETVKQKTSVSYRQCKIIATIGPACWSVEALEKLMDAGMNTALLNMTHGDHAIHGGIIERIRQAASNLRRNIAIMMDLEGPDIRTGRFAEASVKTVDLNRGDTLIITTDKDFRGDKTKISCNYSKLTEVVQPGSTILIADGTVVLTVLSISGNEVTCRLENTTTLGEIKNMALPDATNLDLPTFTEKDVNDVVNFGVKHQVDFISASFVRKASDVTDLRQLLAENGGQSIKIISKIENQEALENYNAILQVSDGIMISRGDLGMHIPTQKVFLAQKMMTREANIIGKPCIVSTQMLESMVHNPRPTRAECGDVANAVLDGTDALMLSAETAVSPYYEKAVRVMARTICEAELSRNYNALYMAVRNSVMSRFSGVPAPESLASSAVKTAIDVDASLIVVLSESGTTARYIAKFRPGKTIVCLTTNPVVARQTGGLLKGVHSYLVESMESDTELAHETAVEAVKAGISKPGDLMVVVCGTLHGHGQNNQIRVEAVPEPDEEDVADLPTPGERRRSTFNRLQSFEVAYNDEVFAAEED